MKIQPSERVPRTTCAVAVGSNLGDRRAHIEQGLAVLEEHPRVQVREVSPLIETPPVGGPPGQGAYLNGAVLLETDLEPEELLDLLLAIERSQGRDRAAELRNGPRSLDLDLLLYGGRELRTERLTVPHPGLEEREFVLAPLSHIAPDLVLPRSGLSVSARLAELRTLAGPGARSDRP